MLARLRALLVSLGLSLTACLDLGGSWDPSATSATSTTTTTTSSSSTLTGTTSGTTTTGTAEATSTSADGETETSGCMFLGCVDMPINDAIECDTWEPDCPQGEKCMPWANDGGSAWNATKCTAVDPNPDEAGEPCTVTGSAVSGVDSCEEGAMCWNVDSETNEGVCVAMCKGSSREPICNPGFYCEIIGDFLFLCQWNCDPLTQDCPDAELCIPVGGGWGCAFDASGEEGQYGDPCEYAIACDPGLVCLNPEYVPGCQAGGCCTPFCDTSAPNTCPGDGQECIPWYEEGMAPPGFETVGFCGVPQ